MIHNLKPYTAYKDSGVPWLGMVPEHWDLVPNRALLKLKKKLVGTYSINYTLLSLTKQGVIARDLENPEGKFPASFDTYQEVKSGDLIFCLFDIDETPRAVGLSSLEGMITGAYSIFECNNLTAIKFIYLFYLAMDNGKHLKPLYTGLRKVITKSTFLSAKMPLPPTVEQLAIVRYLDYIDRRIRRYIRAKQKLVKLLEEQKQAIIHQAVTRGLDPNVKLKPSGVEWLGDVPENWKVVRLGRLVQLTTGFPFKSEGFSQNIEDIRLLRGINVSPNQIRWNSVVRWSAVDYGLYSNYSLKTGDIVLGMDRPIISGGTRVARVQSEDVPALLLQRVARLRPNVELDNEYMLLLLRGRSFSNYLAPIFTGISVPHISPEQICSFRIALPLIKEQLNIVEWVKRSTSKLELAVNSAHREISLLREYRTRLIADVVTGKLDVREVAKSLPEEVEKTETFDDSLAEDYDLENDEIENEQARYIEKEIPV